jgi:FKBP-type peptidyl-prolyl cis-trans isomerase SlyD
LLDGKFGRLDLQKSGGFLVCIPVGLDRLGLYFSVHIRLGEIRLTEVLEKGDDLAVKDGLVVSLAYTLRLDDGEQIDSAGSDDPLVYLHGARNIIPGLEQALAGMKIGDARNVRVEPDNAYGDVDPDAFELVPYEAFPGDLDLAEGMELRMVDEQSGRQMEAFISELREDGALIDMNHPLAGETLHFDVEIVGLRRATSDEIAHGHAHTEGHTH